MNSTIKERTQFQLNNRTEGETLETKIKRLVTNKEPIKDGAPLVYQERKEGIRASTNIRTDRFEVAVEAMDKVSKSYQARREEKGKVIPLKKDDAEGESIHGETDKNTSTK